MAIRKAKPSPHRAQPRSAERSTQSKTYNRRSSAHKLSPGQFVIVERKLPGRRFVEFPLAQGRTVEKVQLFSTTNCESLTITFQDQTSLHLNINPGITLNAEFQELIKGELHTLAEWPPISGVDR